MKLFFFFLFGLMLSTTNNFAQSSLSKGSSTSSLYKTATPVTNAPTANVVTDVFQQNWSNTTFNPYGNAPTKWPIEIGFEGEVFQMPVIGTITSRYGWRKGKAHKGIDIDLNTGDLVKAAMDGKVRFAKYYSGFGNVVVIRHNNGLETVYAHLSKILVEPNEYVFSGFAIGLGGNTGKSRGSHLHFEVRYKNKAINPEYLIDFDNTNELRAQRVVVPEYWAQPNKHRSTQQSNIVVHRPVFEVKEPVHHHTQPNNTIVQTVYESQPLAKTTSTPIVKPTSTSIQKQPETKLPTIKTHVIKKGENLRTIAQFYKTTIEKLCILNGLTRTSTIRVGQIIYIE